MGTRKEQLCAGGAQVPWHRGDTAGMERTRWGRRGRSMEQLRAVRPWRSGDRGPGAAPGCNQEARRAAASRDAVAVMPPLDGKRCPQPCHLCNPPQDPSGIQPQRAPRDAGWSEPAQGGSSIVAVPFPIHACAHKVRGAEYVISPAGFAPACCKVVNKMTGHALNGLTSLSIWK